MRDLIVSEKTTSLHLCVDPQQGLLACLGKWQHREFTSRLRTFSDRIKPNPTLWIASDETIYPTSPTKTLTQYYGLNGIKICDDEDIFVKNKRGAFDDGRLSSYLQEKYPNLESVIVTGSCTAHCVAATIEGAIKQGLKCFAIYDLMADTISNKLPVTALWHKKKLADHVQKHAQTQDVELIGSQDFINRLRSHRLSSARPLFLTPLTHGTAGALAADLT